MTSISQAKKMFHDYLDRKRPWANCNGNVYEAMEEIVAQAAFCFTNEPLPVRPEEVRELHSIISELTGDLPKHPECIGDDDKGICACHECVADAA